MAEQRKGGDPKVGAQLRDVRRQAQLSQAVLGARLGITHGQVSRIESGQRSTTIELVHQWYRECGYELDAVAVGSPEQATSLALAVASLPKAELDAVISIVRAWPALTERDKGRILGVIEAASET